MAEKRIVSLDSVTQSNFETWAAINADLARLKAVELEYRRVIIEHIPFTDKAEGSQTVSVDGALSLELDRPWSYTVKATEQEIGACLTALHQVNPLATVGLLRWKPEISITQYRTLTDEERIIIAPILEVKPGTPALKIVSK